MTCARILSLLALLALTLPGLIWPGLARAEPSDIAAAARSVVRVVLVSDHDGQFGLESHGSGFAVGPDLIITNAHVVEPSRFDPSLRIGIVPMAGESGWFARIVAVAPERDLALLKLTEAGSLPVATLFTGSLTDGADVHAVGYPGNVDLAQGLNVGDIVSPTSPVKTRGTISSGRSSKAFETLLHTAPLGAGNSGGPLLDDCGRVVGANSFGTSFSGGDSDFYFAVSTREIMRFLLAAGVKPLTTGTPCRSIAELDRLEAERLTGERARAAEAARIAAQQRGAAEQRALHKALFEIAEERETRLGIALLALLLAGGAGWGAWTLRRRGQNAQAAAAAVVTGLLLIGAGAAMLSRPGYNDVDSRARELMAGAGGTDSMMRDQQQLSGALVCALIPERSRVTVSSMTDLALTWREEGCADGQRQFGRDADGWLMLQLPDKEDTVTVSRFDPASGEYRINRYFLDLNAIEALRNERQKIKAPACGAGAAAAGRLGDELAGLAAMLPSLPNERLVYRCSASGAATGPDNSSAAPAPAPTAAQAPAPSAQE